MRNKFRRTPASTPICSARNVETATLVQIELAFKLISALANNGFDDAFYFWFNREDSPRFEIATSCLMVSQTDLINFLPEGEMATHVKSASRG